MPTVYYKNPGLTMGQTINIFKKENNISKCCYCGRLDPMARGQLLLLVNDECKDMPKYLTHNKEYKFEIIFGLSTDTDDPLGIINNINNNINYDLLITKIKEYIKVGKFQQKFHNFSSKRVNGEPLWKNHNNIEEQFHEVEIFSVEYNNIKCYNYYDWVNKIINNIKSLDGKFRQEDIINQYNQINLKNINILYSLPITINVSTGFYIRQLVNDIKNYINFPILTFDINRTKIFTN
jgi:tRNA pseudouridine(55) synthase